MAIRDASIFTLGRLRSTKATVLLQGSFTGWTVSAKGRISEATDVGATFTSLGGDVTFAFNLDVKGVAVRFLESSEISEVVKGALAASPFKTSAIKIEVPAFGEGSTTGMLSLVELEE
jgi:hypothetical protein